MENYDTRLRRLVAVVNNPWFKFDTPARDSWGTKVMRLELAREAGSAPDFDTLSELEKKNPGDGFIYAAGPLYR